MPKIESACPNARNAQRRYTRSLKWRFTEDQCLQEGPDDHRGRQGRQDHQDLQTELSLGLVVLEDPGGNSGVGVEQDGMEYLHQSCSETGPMTIGRANSQ
jgi:hypothetical protein